MKCVLRISRLLALLVVATMVLSLAACGSGSKPEDSAETEAPAEEAVTEETPAEETPAKEAPAEEAPAEEAPAEESGEEVTLVVWSWDPNYNIPAIEMAGEYYAKDHPNVKVVVEQTTGDEIYTKLTAAISGSQTDSLPDIMLMHDRNIAKYVTLYPDTFCPLTDTGIKFEDFSAYKVKASTIDGENYALPFDPGAGVYYLRSDILADCGYTLEDMTDITWEELMDIGDDVLEQTGLPILVDRMDMGQILSQVVTSAGMWYFNEDGSTNIADNEALKTFFPIYKEMVSRGILQQYSDGESYNSSTTKGETVGMISAGWMSATIMQGEDLSGCWGYANLPKLPIDGATNYGANGGGSWLVLNKEHQDVAKDFLASTLGCDVELYDEILHETNAIASYTPAQSSESYSTGVEFFGGLPFYGDILKYDAQVPSWNYGIYTAEAIDAVQVALSEYMAGGDLDAVLQTAQETVEFLAG